MKRIKQGVRGLLHYHWQMVPHCTTHDDWCGCYCCLSGCDHDLIDRRVACTDRHQGILRVGHGLRGLYVKPGRSKLNDFPTNWTSDDLEDLPF